MRLFGTANVTMDAVKSVMATFTLNAYTLTVGKVGLGTVTGTGISCGTDCNETYSHGTSVTLTAAPTAGYSFAGWSGACTGTTCTVTMDAAKSVTANFALNTYTLSVGKVGLGTVAGTGIVCGTDCNETFNHGTSVALTATPATGWTFTGWSGACTGMSCTVTMDAAKSVTATFAITTQLLTVSTNAGGTIVGTGISCGNDCSETYNYGTVVNLMVTPATGYAFSGWSGACTGFNPCNVTMDGAKSVTATFTPQMYTRQPHRSGRHGNADVEPDGYQLRQRLHAVVCVRHDRHADRDTHQLIEQAVSVGRRVRGHPRNHPNLYLHDHDHRKHIGQRDVGRRHLVSSTIASTSTASGSQ